MRLRAEFLFLLGAAAPTAAQQAPASPFATLSGVVVDSLRGGPLRGAAVRVAGTARIAFTDSAGRYRIDSVAPGMHSVELFHDILDTLGVRVHTLPMEFSPDSIVSLALGIPSARTISRAKCQPEGGDPGGIFGMVIDADREEPIPGAEVRLMWVELSVGTKVGIRYEARAMVTTTDESGRYGICGLPGDLSADLIAARGAHTTFPVPVEYREGMLGMATLFLSTTDSVGAAGGASVRGIVVDSSDRPVAGARVGLGASADAAVTDSAGQFTLDGQRAGTQALVVRRLGYQPAEVVLNLTRRSPRDVTVRLARFVPVLEAVLVQARRDLVLERVGFAERRRMGTGRHLTQEQLDRRNAFRIADFLTQMPSLRRGQDGGQGCIAWWVDGQRSQAHPDEFMTPREIGAIEVYTASLAPVEFRGLDFCSVVVIWTKWKLGSR